MTHTQPTFSIIMPSYNRKERLKRALEHVAGQTFPAERLEVVVILDGCTDGTAEMLAELQPSYPLALKVVSQPQSGPAAARNRGIREASGEYILFIDDDVMATPTLVEEHWAIQNTHPDAAVIGIMATPPDHRRPVWVRWEEFMLESQYADIHDGKYSVTPRQFYTGNGSMRRESILRAGLFDETFTRYEDVELAYRLARNGVTFHFNPHAIGYHYANRSLQSWMRAHYQYGHYTVCLERDKGVAGMVDILRCEFETRHWLTRVLSARLLNHPKAQRALVLAAVAVAWLALAIRRDALGYRAMSCAANVLFWQGLNDELPQQQANTPAHASGQPALYH